MEKNQDMQSEELREQEGAEAQPEKKELNKALTEALKLISDPRERALRLSRGRFRLEKPIRARSRDIEELKIDFSMLSGMEVVDALDRDAKGNNAFYITKKQALFLFAEAAAKATPDVDSTDILERISVADTLKAVQVAAAFFTASSQAANMRYSTE